MNQIKAKEIRLISISDIKLNPENRNKHPDDQIERLIEIIKYQGFRRPVSISNRTGHLVCGEGRYLAAKKLNFKEIPAIFQDYDNKEQELADAVADNAIDRWAELDISGIQNDVLKFENFNLDLLGIKDFELKPPESISHCDENEVPEVKESICKTGDIWELGNHRLLCGDSTNSNDVERLMNGQKADITFTSPPYNLGNSAKLRGKNASGDDSVYIESSDNKTEDEYLSFITEFTLIALKVSKNVFVNIQLLSGNKTVLPKYWMAFHNKLVDLICWDKEHGPPSMAPRVLNSVWEFIFIFNDELNPSKSIKTGPKFHGTIDNIYRLNPVGKKDTLAKDHGAVFPVEFCEYFITKFSDEYVLDLFGGSGTTLIACEKTNRKCFMMELDPHYCDVIIARWQKYTSKTAILI